MPNLPFATIVDYLKKNYGLVIRYAISGLSGVIANLLVFSLAVEVYALWYMYAAVLGFLVAYLVTFTMHKFWTFVATPLNRTFSQGWLYLLSALATLAVNSALLYVQVEWLGLWPIVGQAIALFISAGFSFIFTSQVTFHVEEDRLEKLYRTLLSYAGSRWSAPLLLIVIGICFMSVRLMYMPVADLTDAPQYIATAQYLAGEGGEFLGHRFLKPLSAGVVVLLASVFSLDYEPALLLQAQFGYLALILAAYWFGIELFNSRKKAFLLALIIMGTYPIVRYGLTPLIEAGSWALYFAALAALLRWSETLATRWFWITSFLLLAGLMWKEYAVLVGMVLGFVILAHAKLTWREKIHKLLQAAFLILVPWALWQWHVYSVFQYSYLDWLAVGADPVAYESMYTWQAIVKSLGMTITLAWPFVFFAWYRRAELTEPARKFLWLLLLPSFGFLLWGYVSSRLFYSLVPLLVPLAVIGLSIFKRYRARLLVVVCIGIINLCLVWLGYQPDVRAWITTFTYGEQ